MNRREQPEDSEPLDDERIPYFADLDDEEDEEDEDDDEEDE